MDPAMAADAIWHVNNFLNQEVAAYDNYTDELLKKVDLQEWRASAWEERAGIYHERMEQLQSEQARARAGAETIVAAIDNMYNLFTEMARVAPEIGRFHEQLQRIVLHAESGRHMLSPVIDLTTEEEEDDERDALIEGYPSFVLQRAGINEVIDLTGDESDVEM